MLLSSSKPYLLQLVFTTLLLTQLDKVKSTDASARGYYTLTSFAFPNFRSYGLKNGTSITFLGGATNAEALQLTRTDKDCTPIKQNAGQALYSQNVFLWDTVGHAASFYTSFSFLVKNYYNDSKKKTADGFAFFLAPPNSSIKESGGRLGLFRYETATDPSKNQVVAVEFDTWPNYEWTEPSYPHIGIDVNTIVSVATKRWDDSDAYGSKIGTARIAYDASSKILTVILTYENGGLYVLSHAVDLAKILPEWVRIGFSGSTGYGETQYILSWNFTSSLDSTRISAMNQNLRSFASY